MMGCGRNVGGAATKLSVSECVVSWVVFSGWDCPGGVKSHVEMRRSKLTMSGSQVDTRLL